AASRESVVRESMESAQAAGCGSQRGCNSADLAASRESVVRESMETAQAAGCGSQRGCNSADLAASRESVVREAMKTGAVNLNTGARVFPVVLRAIAD